MSGIVFFRCRDLDRLKSFYVDKVGCELWLEQADCALFRHGNFIFGLCRREEIDTCGIITFFYETREEVDRRYEDFKDSAQAPPSFNEKYNIYQFFARDPDGRTLEFQYFEHPVSCHFMSDEALITRRSVRKYESTSVSPDILDRVFEICRFAPTSMNTQSYYFKIIRDTDTIARLACVRDPGAKPIGNAPLAVAICSDPGLSRRHIQDGCIAAYHFMLAAWSYGLGTCWIAAMDREDVKEMLAIPPEHYVVTVTPLGYPLNKRKEAPERKEMSWFLR